MRACLVMVVLVCASCAMGPTAPDLPEPDNRGVRVVLVTYQGAPVAGHPVHVEEYAQTRDVLTAADGTFTIGGPCESGVMLTSTVLKPGWTPRVSVQPCGPRFEMELQPVSVSVDR
jgi:hypothetical protein